MTVFILDPCTYTKQALKSAIKANGIKEVVRALDDLATLKKKCEVSSPSVVFINQACFQDAASDRDLKFIIDRQPLTLFVIFIGNENIKFHDFVPVKNNVIITSKFIKISTINMIVRYFLDVKTWRIEDDRIGFSPLRFSKTEAEILNMWMSGYDTLHICSHLRIKEKTLSSHKINIKRKTKATNKQVIYHLFNISNCVNIGSRPGYAMPQV